MRLDEDDFASRTLEAEEERASSVKPRYQFVDHVEPVRSQVRRVQTQVNLLRVFFRRLLQPHDFLRKNLGFIVAGGEFAHDEDGCVRGEQVAIFVEVFVHAKHLHRSFEVFQSHHRVGLVGLFGNAVLDRGDQTTNARHAAVWQLRQRRRLVQAIFLKQRRVRRQRMAGDVETEQLLFVGEQFVLRPFGQFLHRLQHRRFLLLQHAEQGALSPLPVGDNARRARKRPVNLREQRRARIAETITRAGFDERFQCFPVHRARIDTLAQVGERCEFATLAPRFQNALHRNFANSFNRREAEADGGQSAASILLAGRSLPAGRRQHVALGRREVHAALVHVRRQDFDALPARLVDILAELRGVAHVVGHHGAVKLHRVIRLQVSRLIGDDSVGRGVRFVKAVAGKFFEQIENLVRLGFRNAVFFLASLDENAALLRHLLGLFLAHGAPQQIGAAERVAGEHLRSLHHLLLVNQNAVSLAGDRLEQWMFVFDSYFAVPPFDEFRDEFHRAGTIEGDERRDVFDRTDLKLPAQVAHPAGFQLENAERVRLVEQVVGLGVVERQRVNRHVKALRALDHFARVADDRQRL